MKGFKNVLLLSAALGVSSSVTVSAEIYSTKDYYPVVEGAVWTYTSNTAGEETRSIDRNATLNGQAVFSEVETDDLGTVESWISNDSQGLRIHQQISSPSVTGSGVDTADYSPPLRILPESWQAGDHFTFGGSGLFSFPGFASVSVDYTVSSSIGTEGNLTVPAGSFRVVPVSYSLTVTGVVSGETVTETSSLTIWLSHGVGLVKERSNINGVISESSLKTWSIPGSGDELSRAIYWRNRLTGANWYHQMDQAQITDSHLVDRVEDANWKLVAIADFNGDGEDDLLWRHQVIGTNWMYLMQGGKVQESRYVNQVSDLNWMVAGAADLTGDGKADVVLRHTQTGLNWLYTMNGNQITANQKIDQVTTDWFIAGLGDFNGDGMADILWRNPHSGINWLYTMSGAAIESSKKLSTTATEWDVAGVADFDDNGVSDVLWRNNQTGLNWLYLMDANGIMTNSRLNVVQDTNWQVKALGDYDQDGHADIYWRNLVTGKNWIYFMNGNQIKQSSGVNAVSPEWEIQ